MALERRHWVLLAALAVLVWIYLRSRQPRQVATLDYSKSIAGVTDTGLPYVATSFPTPIRTERSEANGTLVVTDLKGAWGGVDASVRGLRSVDDPRYPGWYRTGDGGWYRPDTGESYSPGSSPPAVALPDPSAFIEIDLTAQIPKEQQTEATYMIR